MATIHLLIINRNIRFSIRMKQALEQYGGFEVSPFTAADTALDHLRFQHYDVALVDFTLPDMSGGDLVGHIRALNPNIAIIASPNVPDVTEQVLELGLDGIVDVPCTMRELLPIIEAAISRSPAALPDTMIARPMRDSDDIDTTLLDSLDVDSSTDSAAEAAPEFSSLDSVIFRVGGMEMPAGAETLEVDMSSAEYSTKGQDSQNIEVVLSDNLNRLIEKLKEDPAVKSRKSQEEVEQSVNVFRQLAAEEPPMPALEESGTVGELRALLENTNKREIAAYMMRGDSDEAGAKIAKPATQPTKPPQIERIDPVAEDDERGNTARLILQTTLDETTPLNLTDLLETLDRGFPKRLKSGIKPLPSWKRDEERYIREPDFLEDVPAERPPHIPPGLPEQRTAPPQQATTAESATWDEPDSPFLEDQWEQADPVPEKRSSPLDEILPPADIEDAFPDFDILEDSEALPDELPTDDAVDQQPEPREAAEFMPDEPSMLEIDDFAEEFVRAFGLDDSSKVRPLSPGDDEKRPAAELPPYNFGQVLPAQDDLELPKIQSRLPPPSLPEEQITYGTDSADPQIAEMALTLTQASLELTSEATVLTRGGEIVAYAGTLPLEDIEDIRHSIADDWQAAPGESRIRFVTLPGNGEDYMLYSRRTEGDFTLSLIFQGNMPLRVIRRQSNRIVEALASVPDMDEDETRASSEIEMLQTLEALAEVEEETAMQSTSQIEVIQEHLERTGQPPTAAEAVPAPVSVMAVPAGPLTAYTYLWLIRDPEKPLTAPVAHAIVEHLDQELEQLGWQVNGLNVYEDYVYLLADVPGDTLPNETVADLKARSARIAAETDERINPDTLWADSYCVLTPGRELHQDEIQSFINFSRMR